MFRRITERISSAAASLIGSDDDPPVARLVALGFNSEQATQALRSTNGNVDQAAELLFAQTGSSTGAIASSSPHSYNGAATTVAPPSEDNDDATLQRIMQESLDMEAQRRNKEANQAAATAALRRNETNSNKSKGRSAAVGRAGQAAELRAQHVTSTNSTTTTALAPATLQKNTLSQTHPAVKIIPKLQDKSKEEQIVRCADRLKSSYAAVDTLHRALSAVQKDPDNPKFRRIDKTTVGYQRSVAPAPGAEDMLWAMNYRMEGPQALILDRAMLDPALLYLGISALEQTKLTPEYQQGKVKAAFDKTVADIMYAANSSEAEAIGRANFMAKCPSEPMEGRGALMQVVIGDQTVRRRFDADDTLLDVLHWLGGHGVSIFDKLINSGEWSLVDRNRFPLLPLDSRAHQHNTLQYIGCWPSGKLEVLPNELITLMITMSSKTTTTTAANWNESGSIRGLGAAPKDVV